MDFLVSACCLLFLMERTVLDNFSSGTVLACALAPVLFLCWCFALVLFFLRAVLVIYEGAVLACLKVRADPRERGAASVNFETWPSFCVLVLPLSGFVVLVEMGVVLASFGPRTGPSFRLALVWCLRWCSVGVALSCCCRLSLVVGLVVLVGMGRLLLALQRGLVLCRVKGQRSPVLRRGLSCFLLWTWPPCPRSGDLVTACCLRDGALFVF